MKNKTWRMALLPLGLSLLSACGGAGDEETVKATNAPKGPVPNVDAEPVPVGGVRRLTVDELQGSVPVVAGKDETGKAIQWTVKKNTVFIDAYSDEAFGATLGRPDYVVSTIENAQPTSLYVKFARDMSLDVCNKIVKADLARAPGAPMTLWRKTKVDGTATAADDLANTEYLILRFLGLKVAADDPMVVSLEKVRAEAMANPKMGTNPAAEGWRAVCIALLQDPAFHID